MECLSRPSSCIKWQSRRGKWADNEGIHLHSGNLVKNLDTGKCIVLVISEEFYAKLYVGVLHHGMADTVVNAVPVFTRQYGRYGNHQSIPSFDSRNMNIGCIVHFIEHLLHSFSCFLRYVAALCSTRSTVPADTPAILAISFIRIFLCILF